LKIRITASRHTAFYSPLLSTMAAGFLEKHGVEYTYNTLPPGETAAGMIRSGKTDIMQSAPSTNWAKMDKGETGFPLHFALINRRDGFFLFRRTPDFNWRDLEGKKLLADHGNQPLAMLKYAVKYNGVDWQKITVLNAGAASGMVSAFRAGEGDFVHLQAPVLDLNNFPRTSVGASMPPNAFSSLCASREFIAGDACKAFAKAFAEAKAWVQKTAPEEIAAKQASFFPGLDRAFLASAIAEYKSLGTWDGGIEIPRDLYEQSLTVFESTGTIRHRHAYETCVAPALLP
jgi:NitT/TauT family transport system substrate-binding protein